MWAWLWITPVHCVLHAATSGDGTAAAGLWEWWDYGVGPAVCGVSAYTVVVGAQHASDDKLWAWQAIAGFVAAMYLLRAPLGPVNVLLPRVARPLAPIVASLSVAVLAAASVGVSTVSGDVFRALVAAMLPALYVGTVQLCVVWWPLQQRVERDRDSDAGFQYEYQDLGGGGTVGESPPPSPGGGLAADALKPLLQSWSNTTHRRSTTIPSGTTMY